MLSYLLRITLTNLFISHQWFYSGDHALALKNLHGDYKKRLERYRFEDHERIRSDHLDFIGIECFAGFADGIETYLNLTGLEVDDRDRLKAPSMRAKNKKHVAMTVSISDTSTFPLIHLLM